MAKRLISAVIGVAFVIVVLVFNDKLPLLLNIAISIIAAICAVELLSSMGLLKLYFFSLPNIIFVALIPIIAYTQFWAACWFIYTIVVFSVITRNYDKIIFKDIISAYCLSILIAVALGCIVLLRDYGFSTDSGVFYLVLPLILAWMSDTGAFFVGKLLGKTKLCPNISPKKTVGGAVGGIITGVLSVILCCLIFKWWILPQGAAFHYVNITAMSIIGCFIAILGDLSFSVVKRGCKVKDFGHIIPGHGGFLDRFDSVIFLAPFIYLFSLYLSILN